jgi:hypothetical protein
MIFSFVNLSTSESKSMCCATTFTLGDYHDDNWLTAKVRIPRRLSRASTPPFSLLPSCAFIPCLHWRGITSAALNAKVMPA